MVLVVDTRALKERVDLVALMSRDIQLRRVASTRGGEWAGPCPFCGGTDRFRVWPLSESPGYWCRQCGESGDAITYAMKHDKLGFREACARLGADISMPMAPRTRRPERRAEPAPAEEWQRQGLKVVALCEKQLWTERGERARAWLRGRGLKDNTLREWQVGYSSGLGQCPSVSGQTELGQWLAGLWVPEGIVIPGLGVDGQLWYLKVRRPAGEPKYVQVKGSHPALVGRLKGKTTLLLTEGEFDAMLAWQEVGDLLDVATLGSAGADPTSWLRWLLTYEHILVAYDVDKAGDEGAERLIWMPRARRLRVPLEVGKEGKDLSELFKAGGDLRAWLKCALLASGGQGPTSQVGAASRESSGGRTDVRQAELGHQLREPRPTTRCYACGADEWWERPSGGWCCGVCHPNPARLA